MQNSIVVQNIIYSQNKTEANVQLNKEDFHFMGIIIVQLISVYHL